MQRKIIHIDTEKCNGCGACANACHEGAIAMVDGKAKLIRDDYCDGMGDCLPQCPTGAITFEVREAAAYDHAAVQEHRKAKASAHAGCPGNQVAQIPARSAQSACVQVPSGLRNWPVQIKLAPVKAPYYDNARLLIAADCTAFAYANFHAEFMQNKTTLIACPKPDGVDYSEKLTEIIRSNSIQNVTILRMEVPCCGGLEMATRKALQNSGKPLPWQVITISTDGQILD